MGALEELPAAKPTATRFADERSVTELLEGTLGHASQVPQAGKAAGGREIDPEMDLPSRGKGERGGFHDLSG